MSSSVTSPRMLPNSSTTMARPVRRARNSSSSSLAGFVSGTISTSRSRFLRSKLQAAGNRSSGAARAIEQQPDHVLDVNEAEDVVERAFVNGNARALRGGEHAHGFFEARLGGQRVHVRARHHHFAHLHLAQLHRVLNEFRFARRAARRGRAPAGSSPAVLRPSAPACGCAARRRPARRRFFRTVPSSRSIAQRKVLQKPVKRPRDKQRDALGAREAQSLGNQLAENDLQKREQPESDAQAPWRARRAAPTGAESSRTSGPKIAASVISPR